MMPDRSIPEPTEPTEPIEPGHADLGVGRSEANEPEPGSIDGVADHLGVGPSPKTGRPFVWPPSKGGGRDPGRSDRTSPEAAPGERGRASANARQTSVWGAIESYWLDLRVPPLPARLERVGWVPDPIDRCCMRCGAGCGEFESRAGRCQACDDWTEPPWDRLVRVGTYDFPWRSIVHDIKFTAWRRLGVDAGRMLGDRVRATMAWEIAEGRLDPSTLELGVGVVPMPDSPLRRLSRGIDHALAIARGVAAGQDADAGPARWVVVRPLWREWRPSQVDVRPSDRAANASASVHARRWYRAPRPLPRFWLVVDDVVTTGSTMRATCRALRQSLAERGLRESNGLGVWASALTVAGGRELDGR